MDDPQYDMLYVIDRYESDEYALRFRVVDGGVVADARFSTSPAAWPNQILFRFDAGTQTVKRVEPTIPELVRQQLRNNAAADRDQARPLVAPAPVVLDTSETFEVAETASLQLLPDSIAPDGYEFRNEFGGSRGLFGELFGMSSRRSSVSVARKGRVIPLLMPEQPRHYYYNNSRLLGWIAQ